MIAYLATFGLLLLLAVIAAGYVLRLAALIAWILRGFRHARP